MGGSPNASGIWEARVGIGLRLAFTLQAQLLTLVRVATHDEIRRFLRELSRVGRTARLLAGRQEQGLTAAG
jgi:hypothetical protein